LVRKKLEAGKQVPYQREWHPGFELWRLWCQNEWLEAKSLEKRESGR
jgi:hypothetical protein